MIRLIATFLVLLSSPALATLHQEIQVNQDVAGTRTHSEGETCGRVLILHGYQDHRDGVGDLQKELAEALSENNIESLRIDFRGEGERNGYRVTSTFTSRLQDAEAAYQVLNQDTDVPTGVFGFSLGGLTAMTLASQHPDWFNTMVVWSAAGSGAGNLVSNDANMNKAIREALHQGEAKIQSWTEMTITREFILSYLGVNVMDTLANYPGSFLSIRGDEDFLPADERHWIKQMPNQDASYLTIKNADHIFRVLEPGNTIHQNVIDATVSHYQSRLCEN